MIHIGNIVKPQGLKGEVKVITINSVDRYENLKRIFIDKKEIPIEKLSVRQKNLHVKLFGVDNRDAAENLRGKEVFAFVTELKPLRKNEFYFKDLIGAKVYDLKNNFIGELIDIEQYGAADVILIKENGNIYSVPFIEDVFVKVDMQNIIVDIDKYNDIKII